MPRPSLRAALLLTALLAPLGIGCGKKGPPRAPELVIPRGPDPVQAESSPDGIKLAWRRPREYVDGAPLDDLAGFQVLRACQPEGVFAPIASVPVTDNQRFRKQTTFTLIDDGAPLGVSCRYQVIAFTLDDYTSPPAESPDVVRTVAGALP